MLRTTLLLTRTTIIIPWNVLLFNHYRLHVDVVYRSTEHFLFKQQYRLVA
jgi:hypothetical protein